MEFNVESWILWKCTRLDRVHFNCHNLFAEISIYSGASILAYRIMFWCTDTCIFLVMHRVCGQWSFENREGTHKRFCRISEVIGADEVNCDAQTQEKLT